MLTDVQALVLSSILLWVMVVAASMIRVSGWTIPGFIVALGNRDDLPDASAIAARADRAAKNMIENLVLFVAIVAAARFANAPADRVTLGVTIFFWARVAYFFIYLAGVKALRTAIWIVSLIGVAIVGAAALNP
jgi:uncharacterized MAPEG superfamily protein